MAKRKAFGHQEITATECPGTLMADFVRPFRAGKDFGGDDAPPKTNVLHRVQTGAFSKKTNAERLARELKTKGYETHIVREGGLHKVQLGAFAERPNAARLVARLKGQGYDAFIVTK